MIWISGEISNLRIPSSGHAYFTLKDKKAQIAGVMFKGQLRQLRFDLDDGMTLVGMGRISVYEPRGTYQIILEYAEPKGIGALQIAFEQLKQKLYEEGLFAQEHKKELPFLPNRPGIITSPTGAVIRDILNISGRRFPNLTIDIFPVRVQGDEAKNEIVKAIELANRLGRNDILILARGGGSLEDLAPFNSERVARAIYGSLIPIVSAVGHETDFTIADFVADVRAPTPSAAAEIAIPMKIELRSRANELSLRCRRTILAMVRQEKDRMSQYNRLLVHPGQKVQDARLHVDQLVSRLRRGLSVQARQVRSEYEQVSGGLMRNSPAVHIALHQHKIDLLRNNLLQFTKLVYLQGEQRFNAAQGLLRAMNPAAVLERGYSITRTVPQGKVVSDAATVSGGQPLEIQLARGRLEVVVQENIRTSTDKE